MKRRAATLLCLLLAAPALFGAEETLALGDGSEVRVLYFQPHSMTEQPPLAILVAGGSSNEFMARAQFWFGKELVDRGWAIAVPISPDGDGFAASNATFFPRMIELLHESHDLRAGQTLLAGISTGGSAALDIAALHPELYLGVLATPGRLRSDAQLPPLAGLPVYLRIGEKDIFRWDRNMDDIAQTLEAAGARVDAAIVPGAKHIFQLDWANLEAWLTQIQQAERATSH